MVKLRDARYCNLKLLLIYLVLYGHLIETGTGRSTLLEAQYRWIYLIHMPMFSFLSGLFLNGHGVCRRQLARTLSLYTLLQAACVLCSGGRLEMHTPFWHLWYLLSSSCWFGAAGLWYRFGRGKGKLPILAGSVLVGCAAGYVPFIGRLGSVSRTLVFFPYFWAGLMCDRGFPWERLRPFGLAALCAAAAVMMKIGKEIPVGFLYQAEPYGSLGNGFMLRLLCYLLAALLGLFLLAFVPAKRFPFTGAGADTMPAYLLHAPVVLLLRRLEAGWPLCMLMSALLLYVIFKIQQWRGEMYGVVPPERRERGWPPFKKSMKNMPGRSTGSCSP